MEDKSFDATISIYLFPNNIKSIFQYVSLLPYTQDTQICYISCSVLGVLFS